VTTITEETLRGEWFYLEEDEPLNLARAKPWALADGEVRQGSAVIGTYQPSPAGVVLDMHPTGDERRWTITLRPIAGQVDAGIKQLQADSVLVFGGQEPWGTVGSFIRKVADRVDPKRIRALC